MPIVFTAINFLNKNSLSIRRLLNEKLSALCSKKQISIAANCANIIHLLQRKNELFYLVSKQIRHSLTMLYFSGIIPMVITKASHT